MDVRFVSSARIVDQLESSLQQLPSAHDHFVNKSANEFELIASLEWVEISDQIL